MRPPTPIETCRAICEDFIGCNMSVKKIAAKHEVSEFTVLKVIGRYLGDNKTRVNLTFIPHEHNSQS
jgi:transposase